VPASVEYVINESSSITLPCGTAPYTVMARAVTHMVALISLID